MLPEVIVGAIEHRSAQGQDGVQPLGVQHMPVRLRRMVTTVLQQASMRIHLTYWTPLSHETHRTH
jgi:hypothetical protein